MVGTTFDKRERVNRKVKIYDRDNLANLCKYCESCIIKNKGNKQYYLGVSYKPKNRSEDHRGKEGHSFKHMYMLGKVRNGVLAGKLEGMLLAKFQGKKMCQNETKNGGEGITTEHKLMAHTIYICFKTLVSTWVEP